MDLKAKKAKIYKLDLLTKKVENFKARSPWLIGDLIISDKYFTIKITKYKQGWETVITIDRYNGHMNLESSMQSLSETNNTKLESECKTPGKLF